MALPSQSDRSIESGRTNRLQGKPGGVRPRWIAAVVGVVVLGSLIVFGMVRTFGTKTNSPSGDPLAINDPAKVQAAGIGNPPLPDPGPVRQAPLSPPPTNDWNTSKPNGTQGANPDSNPNLHKPTPVNVVDPSGTNPLVQGEKPVGPGGAPSTGLPATASSDGVRSMIEAGESAASRGELVKARELLSKALNDPRIIRSDADGVRARLQAINEDLVFSKKITVGDPMVEQYVIESGDALARLPRKRELVVDWRLLQRVNGITNPQGLRIGQKLKLVRGPFHAVVNKSEYRLDIFWGPPGEPSEWVYIRSFRVGLGADNGTPLGHFVVKRGGKLVNPPWVNPRTGEKFGADDPKNPIGERWIGWEGLGDSAVLRGFGIHGTIEPDSIGQQRSMGCVRMGSDDVELVYELLVEEISTVTVKP